jgi:hypothetical protein
MKNPSTAVSMKFALVLMTLTRTVLLASVRARVKSPHMMALKSRFIPKKNCQWMSLAWVKKPAVTQLWFAVSYYIYLHLE